MRLYGFSEAPNITQYLHLGYLSATIPAELEGRSPLYTNGGLTSFVIGVGLALIAWQRSKILFALGLLLSIAGITAFAYAPVEKLEWGEFEYKNPDLVTEMHVGSMAHNIEKHIRAGDPIPTDVRIMKKEWLLKESDIQDAWFRDLRIEKNSEGSYTVISAAKDGVFGTEDDIKMKDSVFVDRD